MPDQHDPKPADNDDVASDPVDCSEEAAQRAGAKHSSLSQDDAPSTEPDVEKDDISEADVDDAIEESMDGSDPPAFLQP